jgi:cytoskeleton protein RodZ
VSDARGKVLIARIVQPGESLELDGAAPLRVRVGNASGTQLSFRGRPVNLAAARDNTANVELK